MDGPFPTPALKNNGGTNCLLDILYREISLVSQQGEGQVSVSDCFLDLERQAPEVSGSRFLMELSKKT